MKIKLVVLLSLISFLSYSQSNVLLNNSSLILNSKTKIIDIYQTNFSLANFYYKNKINRNLSSDDANQNNTILLNDILNSKLINDPIKNSSSFLQEPPPEDFKFWKLISYSGEVKAKGYYSEQNRSLGSFSDFQRSSSLSGGILLNTSSYFLHPKFLIMNLNGEYNPETRMDRYLITPDQAQQISIKRLNIQTTFLNQKPVTFSPFINFDDSYITRENLTNIKSNSTQWGARLTSNLKYFPLLADFSQRKWTQTEIPTNRTIHLDENLFHTSLIKSFTKFDRNELMFSDMEHSNINENFSHTYNKVQEVSLNDEIVFDKKRNYRIYSNISNTTNQGYINFNRFMVLENLNLRLPKNFTLAGNYNLNNYQNSQYKLSQNTYAGSLGYKLFKSLESKVFYEKIELNHSLYKETNQKIGGELKYSKKIPTGNLFLYYKYYRYHQDMKSDPKTLLIQNEETLLIDNQIVLLSKPYANINSVVVKDVTGTIFYQINLDYVLVQRNNFIEIRRVPGGMITNNTSVFVDYTATQPGDYKYDANCNFFNASLFLFKNKLELYYKRNSQNFVKVDKVDYLSLNYFTQNVVGTKLDFGFINFGVDYDYYKSSILPYKMTRYFVNVQKSLNQKVTLLLNCNRQEYHMINENLNQIFNDVIGKVTYQITRKTAFNIESMYRKQQGAGIDLDLITGTAELTTSFRQIYISLKAEVYKREFISEKIYFRGGFLTISRRF